MHRIQRPSLAALLCPSAPFLAPRFQHTAAPLADTFSKCCHLQKNAYATASKRGRREASRGTTDDASQLRITRQKTGQRFDRSDPLANPFSHVLKRFRQACKTRNLPEVMDLYPTIVAGAPLRSDDTRLITQALHYACRQRAKSADMFPFVLRIIEDLRSGALPPHHQAFVHILSMYKESKRFEEGLQLWHWLAEQGDAFVSQEAYGAAIELMAYGGLADLVALEKVYKEGLRRFPGTFADYHLSPDAIVPDRSQPIMIPGIPVVLFQGILTARILARDSRKSYLALDTLLRLYPTQTPRRAFDLFIRERPAAEAYAAVMVACRTGVCVSPSTITILLSQLEAAMNSNSSQSDRLLILNSMANALYAYMQAGISQQTELQSVHVSIFIRSFAALVPDAADNVVYEEGVASLRTSIAVAAHKALSQMFQAGLLPDSRTLQALLVVAGRLRVPKLFTTTLADIDNAQIELNPAELRSTLSSAGSFQESKDVVHQIWNRMVATYEKEGSQITPVDWYTLTQVCRRISDEDFLQQQLDQLSHTTTAEIHKGIARMKPKQTAAGSQDFSYMTTADWNAELGKLEKQTGNIGAVVMSGQPLHLSKNPFYIHINPQISHLASHKYVREIYDELTTDAHQPSLPPPVDSDNTRKVYRSSTGIRLDELRYQNWVSVLEMMAVAEQSEQHFQRSVDEAVTSGRPVDRKTAGFLDPTGIVLDIPETKDGLRAWIRRLRAG